MKQPELGLKIAGLRKQKNLTQEELVERCHVSVRTIQRIEAGEVIPRISTIKIILAAMDEDINQLIDSTSPSHKPNFLKYLLMIASNDSVKTNGFGTALLLGAISGAVYLALEILLTALDVAWIYDELDATGNAVYVVATVCSALSFFFFMRGFVALGHLFENSLIRIGAYMLMIGFFAIAALDIYSLFFLSKEALIIPYSVASVILGSLGIVFGVALIKLQDGMGELSKVAGILEIIVGCLLITVLLFFLAYVVLIPAVILEIILLYKGYDYVTNLERAQVQPV